MRVIMVRMTFTSRLIAVYYNRAVMQDHPRSIRTGVLRVLGVICTQPAVRGLTSGFRMLTEYDTSQTT
jgi:hypothetical protein